MPRAYTTANATANTYVEKRWVCQREIVQPLPCLIRLNEYSKVSAPKLSKGGSTSRFQADQPRLHMLTNKDIKTSSYNSNDNFIEVSSTKRSSNSSKHLLETANNKVNNQAKSHKRLKVYKDTSLPNSQFNLPYNTKASINKSKV